MGRRGNDWRLFPAAAGAWAGAAVGTSAWSWAFAVAGVALLVVPFVWARSRWVAVGLVVAGVLATMSGLLAGQRAGSALASLADDGAIVSAELGIVSEPRPRPPRPPMPPSVTAHATVHWVEGRGQRVVQQLPVLLTASGEVADELRTLVPGARYVMEARLAETEPGDGFVAIVRVRSIEERTAEPGLHEQVAAGLRQGLREAVANAPPEQRALVPSLVVGDTSLLTEELSDDFRDTGLTHLMAVSGANLALMMGVILALLRVAGVRGWAVRVVAAGGVGMFVVVCGPEPSVQRAAVMGLVALAATGVGKGRRSIRALNVAVLVLMTIDPWLSRAPGFWLSFAACLGIVLLGPAFIEALTRWAPRWLAEALSIPLAAQLLTQPIITGLSGEVSIVGVFTNVVAGPFVGPATVLGFAAACLSPLPWLAAIPGWGAGWAAQPILWIAHLGAELPTATIVWVEGVVGVVLIAVLCVGLIPLIPPVLRRWWATILACCGWLGATVVAVPTPGWPGEWDVAFCDVGQGDATVLRIDDHSAALVDAGPEPGPVLRCLDELGVQHVPLVILTHFHADHVGGFEAVATRYQPGLVLTSGMQAPEAAAAHVRRTSNGAQVRAATAGETLRIGHLTWTTASVWEPTTAGDDEGESAVENDSSVVGVAETGGVRVLLAGDAEPDGQRAALRSAATVGVELRADVLKLPHHGSARQEPDFFAASQAGLAVASAGEGNSHGHPAPAALDLSRRHGMMIARTDEQGTVTIVRDGALQVRVKGK